MKITKITLHNYRAFYGTHSIDLGGEGKNLLLYGENGSGKSSLYKGLDTFFTAASLYSNDKAKWEHNIFLPTNEEKENVFIELQVDTIDTPIVLSKPDEKLIGENAQFVRDANKIRGFLDYRRLLKTHLNTDNEVVNLFDILIYEMLYYIPNRFYITDPDKPLGEIWEEIEYEINEVRQGVDVVDWIKEAMQQFNDGLNLLLTKITEDTQSFLNYFLRDGHLEIGFDFQGVNYIGRRQIGGNKVFLTVKINGEQIPYQEFLNEARLSALAISLYLAAIKNNPSETNPFKLLFLDDIFIGLDMSNRLPLLAILREHFDDYQVFMTTYDRNWYEVAKDWFEHKAKDKWAFFEMYVDNITHNFDVPVILESKSFLAKAFQHEKAFDYPAAANYLRKATEEFLVSKFKGRVLKGNDGLDTEGLDRQIKAVILFLKKIEYNATAFENISVYVQSLMNPLSHHDSSVSVFKRELQEVRKTLENLKDFPRFTKTKILLKKGEIVSLKLVIDAKTTNVYTFELKENMLFCKTEGSNYFTNSEISGLECWEVISGVPQQKRKFNHKIYQKTTFKEAFKQVVAKEELSLSISEWKMYYFYEDKNLVNII